MTTAVSVAGNSKIDKLGCNGGASGQAAAAAALRIICRAHACVEGSSSAGKYVEPTFVCCWRACLFDPSEENAEYWGELVQAPPGHQNFKNSPEECCQSCKECATREAGTAAPCLPCALTDQRHVALVLPPHAAPRPCSQPREARCTGYEEVQHVGILPQQEGLRHVATQVVLAQVAGESTRKPPFISHRPPLPVTPPRPVLFTASGLFGRRCEPCIPIPCAAAGEAVRPCRDPRRQHPLDFGSPLPEAARARRANIAAALIIAALFYSPHCAAPSYAACHAEPLTVQE